MCNASNHPPDCTCGFGGQYYGSEFGDLLANRNDEHLDNAIRSAYIAYFTGIREKGQLAPNAHCPVCGETVYFYESPYGGRVYFDDVGEPWPKHPCTDRSLLPRKATRTPASSIEDEARAIMQNWVSMHEPKIKRNQNSLLASISWKCPDGQIARLFFRMHDEKYMKNAMSHRMTARYRVMDGPAPTRADRVKEHITVELIISYRDPSSMAWLHAQGVATPHSPQAAHLTPLTVSYLGNLRRA